MSIYVITGKLGSGKGLQAVCVIQEFLKRGRYVATNMDIFPEHMFPPYFDTKKLQRLPDYPSINDFNNIGFQHFNEQKKRHEGRGTLSKNYKFFGALVLDEMSVWMNSHNWNDPKMMDIRSWIANARKLGWHVFFITQNVDQMDKQVRESFIEFEQECRALELSFIPFVGSMLSGLFSSNAKEEDVNTNDYRLHLSLLKMGFGQSAIKLKRKFILNPKNLYLSYDTNQVYLKGNESNGLHTVLSPLLTKGRYLTFMQLYKKLMISSVLLGLFLGFLFTYIYSNNKHLKELNNQKTELLAKKEKDEKKSTFDEKTKIIGMSRLNGQVHLTIDRDGKTEFIIPNYFKETREGICVYEKDSQFGVCDNSSS